MRFEFMPGHRPPDTPHSLASGADSEASDKGLRVYKEEQLRQLRSLLKIADAHIQRLSNQTFIDHFSDKFTSDEVLTQLDEWIEIANQIVNILIKNALTDQSLQVELEYSLVTNLPAEEETVIADLPDLIQFRETLQTLLNSLQSLFDRCPSLRFTLSPKIATVLLILASLSLVLATASSANSQGLPKEPPPAVATQDKDSPDTGLPRSIWPLTNNLVQPDPLSARIHSTWIPTTTPLTPQSSPNAPYSPTTPQSQDVPLPTPTVTTEVLIAAATGGAELTPAQADLLTQDLLASIQRFYAASNSDFDTSDPALLTAIHDAVAHSNPSIDPITQLPSYEIAYGDITFTISLLSPENSNSGETPIWQVTSSENSSADIYSEESMAQASIQLQTELRELFFSESANPDQSQAVTRELDPITDQELINTLKATIGNDFSLDFSAFTEEEQRVLMPGRMLLVEPNSGVVAHSALLDLGESTTVLLLPYHVLEALLYVSGDNYYLCYSTSEGLKFVELTQFTASVARNVVNPSDEAWVAVNATQITVLQNNISSGELNPLKPLRFNEKTEFGILSPAEIVKFTHDNFWISATDVDPLSFPKLTQAQTSKPFIYSGYSGSTIHVLDLTGNPTGYTAGSLFRSSEERGNSKCDIVVAPRFSECQSGAIIKRLDLPSNQLGMAELTVFADRKLTAQYGEHQYVIRDELPSGEVTFTVQEPSHVEGTFRYIGENGLPVTRNFSFNELGGENAGRWGGEVIDYELLYLKSH